MAKVRASNLKPYEIAAWFASHDPLQELDQMQQALILAKFKLRPKLHPAIQTMQQTMITWRGMVDGQISGSTVLQVASIIKAHKQISKLDLIKECERVLTCKGTIVNAVNNSLKLLKTRTIIQIKKI